MDRTDSTPPGPPPQGPPAAGRPRAPLAVIGLSGAALRYAEISRDADEAPAVGRVPGRLLRLGTCDFEVDIEQGVLGDGAPYAIQGVGEALREVFRDTAAEALVIVAHPPHTTSFFTPVPVGMDAAARDEQLRQEAALLADVGAEVPVRVRAVPLRLDTIGGAPHRWHHVTHVSEPIHARLSLLARALGVDRYDLSDSPRAAASIVRASVAVDRPEEDGVELAVGAYATHTEVSLSRGRAWLFGHHGPGATAEDTAYFALAALERIGLAPGDVARLWAYGEEGRLQDRLSLLEGLLDTTAAPLDPLSLYGRRPDGLSADHLAAFAPVLGATLS